MACLCNCLCASQLYGTETFQPEGNLWCGSCDLEHIWIILFQVPLVKHSVGKYLICSYLPKDLWCCSVNIVIHTLLHNPARWYPMFSFRFTASCISLSYLQPADWNIGVPAERNATGWHHVFCAMSRQLWNEVPWDKCVNHKTGWGEWHPFFHFKWVYSC